MTFFCGQPGLIISWGIVRPGQNYEFKASEMDLPLLKIGWLPINQVVLYKVYVQDQANLILNRLLFRLQ